MMAGDFLKCLKRLNPKLKVCSFGDNTKLAGIYYIDEVGEYQDVCGIDKHFVPEHTEFDDAGHIVKGGWRRAVLVLLDLKLTTSDKVRKVWPGFFLHRSPGVTAAVADKVQAKIDKFCSADKEFLSRDEIMEVAADVRAKDSTYTREQNEKERWFLETWKSRGGNKTDKPTL